MNILSKKFEILISKTYIFDIFRQRWKTTMLINDTCDASLALNIDDEVIEMSWDEGILRGFLGFWVIERHVGFRIDLQVVMSEIGISEN